jgi:tRNA G10  N-methylase Trm11
MRYFFAPGRMTELSVAELKVVLNTFLKDKYEIEKVDRDLLIVHTVAPRQQMDRIFNRLGGFIKYGELIEDLETFLDQFESSTKVTFGISVSGISASRWDTDKVKELLEKIKTSFKQRGVKARYILPKRVALNAGQILKNSLLQKGFELNIFETSKGSYYARTHGIQDIELFSLLDYGKPFTDKQMGVLPTKLAKILVNLAGVKEGSTIWDPFCGSGTVLLEGLVAGYNVIGSDNDDKAVKYSTDNIKWLSQQGVLGDVKYNVFNLDVVEPDKKLVTELRNTAIDAIVCEPFMGPPQFRTMATAKANTLLEEVSSLYEGLFKILDNIKKYQMRMVIVVPSFKTDSGWATMSINSIVGKKWEIENRKYGEDLHWERPNSIIRRNIFILSRK